VERIDYGVAHSVLTKHFQQVSSGRERVNTAQGESEKVAAVVDLCVIHSREVFDARQHGRDA
jgi:hypothetical protein